MTALKNLIRESLSAEPQARHPIEIVLITLFGLVGLCGLGGMLFSFILTTDTNTDNIVLAPVCFSLFFACLTSMGLIWFRNRRLFASAWLAMGITFWFVGILLLGLSGGVALLGPGDASLENFGFTTLFCFVPSSLLSLLGLGLYGYARSQGFSSPPLAQKTLAQETSAQETTSPPQNDKLRRAEAYRRHILQLIEQKEGTPLAVPLALIPPKLEQWHSHLVQLIKRVDDFEANPVIQRDLREVPAMIAQLEAKLAAQSTLELRTQMTETLDGLQEQQRQLDALVDLIHQTELEIEETLANIGAIYSQLQMLDLKGMDNDRAKRLSASIDEQAARLGDLLEAMDEVHLS